MKPRHRHRSPREDQASGSDGDQKSTSPSPQPGEDPFSVLGIAPTLEVAAVKRAYFAALARHPPHRDREGFQRLRAAYEALMAPEGLAAAYAASPPDLVTELARYRARFDALLTQAAARPREVEGSATRAAQCVEQLSRMSWSQTLAALSSAQSERPPQPPTPR
jgi:hypothetical protein